VIQPGVGKSNQLWGFRTSVATLPWVPRMGPFCAYHCFQPCLPMFMSQTGVCFWCPSTQLWDSSKWLVAAAYLHTFVIYEPSIPIHTFQS
jgi:hypothetical protein